MQSPPVPRYLVLSGPDILLNTLFSNTLRMRYSLSVSDQVSHPYQTTRNVIVLYILVFKFLESKMEDKIFYTERQQALPEFNLFLISSWTEFRFITVTNKYLKCSTVSRELLSIFIWTALLLTYNILRHVMEMLPKTEAHFTGFVIIGAEVIRGYYAIMLQEVYLLSSEHPFR